MIAADQLETGSNLALMELDERFVDVHSSKRYLKYKGSISDCYLN